MSVSARRTGGQLVKPGNSNLNNPELQALRQTVSDARKKLETAHVSYERALATNALEDSRKLEAALALQRLGRNYASAVVRYSGAAMAWLASVDKVLVEKNRYR